MISSDAACLYSPVPTCPCLSTPAPAACHVQSTLQGKCHQAADQSKKECLLVHPQACTVQYIVWKFLNLKIWRAQEDTVDADQIPTWIRAHFMMEERWGELEAEHQAAAQAVQLAESWGMVRTLAHVPSS